MFPIFNLACFLFLIIFFIEPHKYLPLSAKDIPTCEPVVIEDKSSPYS